MEWLLAKDTYNLTVLLMAIGWLIAFVSMVHENYAIRKLQEALQEALHKALHEGGDRSHTH